MVKKTAVILGILAMLVVSAGISWGYTVSQWPPKGIPNTMWGGSPCLLPPAVTYLSGPVAPACEPPFLPGLLNACMSVPFRGCGLVLSPFVGGPFLPGEECCPVDLGPPAYVTAAVPCTPVNQYVPPRGW